MEIGSEFWDVPATAMQNGLFPDSAAWYLCGRSALSAVIENLPGVHSVSMPSWCCSSMVVPFIRNGIRVSFYPVYFQAEKGRICQEISSGSDMLFLMDYFGYGASDGARHSCVIRDVTHSMLSRKYEDADYYFGSLRKWCGVWTGGFAWGRHKLRHSGADVSVRDDYAHLRRKAMEIKRGVLLSSGATDAPGSKEQYLRLFGRAEELLERAGRMPAAERDIELAGRLDVEFIRLRRRANALILMERLKEFLLFKELPEGACPLFVPIWVPDGRRDELRDHLRSEDIFCPIHWPMEDWIPKDPEISWIYGNELSLVCDQRYDAADMEREADAVKEFLEGYV